MIIILNINNYKLIDKSNKMLQSTPKLEPNVNNSPIGNLDLHQSSKFSYGDNIINNQSYHSSERQENKSLMSNDEFPPRKVSLKPPKIKESELLKIINNHHNKYLPEASNEVIENINMMKDYKWKLGVILTEKINTLNQKIKEENDRIDKKKKEINETKVYEKKINYLKQLIRKEEAEGYPQEYKTNLELQKKKKSLTDQLNQIEQNKKNLKEIMMKKFSTMMELKLKLKNSLNELLLIQQQIRSRKFANDQEESGKEPSIKIDPEEKSLLHLSQNIGEHFNKNLLIKKNE